MGNVTKDRNLSLVLDAILNQIPPDYENLQDLILEFTKIKSDIPYTAPELMYMRWGLAMEVLMIHLPLSEGMPHWKRTVVDIFNSKLDYKNYLQIPSL